MEQLLLVTVPAFIAAGGAVLAAYITVKVRAIAVQTNSRMTYLENELRLTRRLLEEKRRAGT